MFYPYEGYRSVTPVDAARVNRTIFANFHRSDVLSVSSWSYFDCSSILPVFYLMTSHNQARSIIFCPSSDQKIPGRKLIASAKYQTGTIGNDVVRLISIMLLFVVFYAPFWLIMLKRGNYARGCVHFFYLFACPSFYMRFFVCMARFLLLIRCFARDH